MFVCLGYGDHCGLLPEVGNITTESYFVAFHCKRYLRGTWVADSKTSIGEKPSHSNIIKENGYENSTGWKSSYC